MGLRDLFRRSKSTDLDAPIGMGDDDGDNEPGEGGPSIFKKEMAEMRWAAQQEALNVGRGGIDPGRWEGGRMAFEHERGLAHGHARLRDMLSNYVGAKVRDEARELYSLAGDVALARDELREVDVRLVEATKDWRKKRAEIAEDELELSRYHRLRSISSNYIKYGIAILFVISEFIISGLVFERIFTQMYPGLGYIMALGITLVLIVIPHYTAVGLKNGLTKYHVFKKEALERDNQPPQAAVERAVHMETEDDNVFRTASFIVGVGLLLLILPLSLIRVSAEKNGDVKWVEFFFLLLLQLALSGYFFLREWLDYGHLSHDLHKKTEDKEAIEAERRVILERMSDAVSDFHDTAEDLIFTLQQFPRWDSQIVHTYYETLHYFRHLVADEQREFDQFIYWARIPYLGSKDTMDGSAYPLDPLSEEHRILEEDGPVGREWLQRTAAEALAGIKHGEDGEPPVAFEPAEASWLVTKSPDLLLSVFLRRYFDLDVEYKRPAELDLPPDDESDERVDANPAPEGEESESDGAERPEDEKHLQVVSSDESDGHVDSQPSHGLGAP